MTILKFNVAQLLREGVGARRTVDFTEAALPLDDALVLRNIGGQVRFARTNTGVFAKIRATGSIFLDCARCLNEFEHSINLTIADEFHSVVDVVTGVALPKPLEEDPFFLDQQHQADVGELVREYTLLDLPLSPVCAGCRDQPIIYSVESVDLAREANRTGDARLEILKSWKST